MNLTLKPELAEFIQQEILTGTYASPDESITANLDLEPLIAVLPYRD